MSIPEGFWLGLVAVPAVVAFVSVAVGLAAVAMSLHSKYAGSAYKLVPRKFDSHAGMASIVACAKWVRYMWIPGFHVVICKTSISGREPGRAVHARVKWAIVDALERDDS